MSLSILLRRNLPNYLSPAPMKKARLTFEIDSVMRLPPSAQSGICQQRAKEENQRKLSDAACKQQQKRYKYVKY